MSERALIGVIGAGGFAREVRWLINEMADAGKPFEFAGYFVSDRRKLSDTDDVDSVVAELSELVSGGFGVNALAIGIGDPVARAKVGRQLSSESPDIGWPSLIHPSVIGDIGSWSVGRGTIVCAGVTGTVNVVLNDFCMVNINSTIGHEATIGVGAVVNPLVSISGGVRIGAEALVGTSATLLQYVAIGDRSTVGAGAVVVRDVDPDTTVVGVPAKPVPNR